MNRPLVAILILSCLASLRANAADPVPVKNWVYQLESDGSAGAWTNNDSGSSFGVYCSPKYQCVAFFETDTGCDDKSTYPLMINSDSGAQSLIGTCANLDPGASKPKYALVLDHFDLILKVMLKDHSVGIALPLQDGQYKVARFSLEGSNETIAAVKQAFTTAPNDVTSQGSVTADQVL